MFGLAKKLVSSIETQASTYLQAANSGDSEFDGVGLRVLNVEKDSLGEKYGFESWFDYVTGINGREICSFFQQGQALSSNPYSQAEPEPVASGAASTGKMGGIDPSNVDYSVLLDFLKYEVTEKKADLAFDVWSGKGSVTRPIVVPNEEFTSSSSGEQLDDVDMSAGAESGSSGVPVVHNNAFRKLRLTLQLTPLVAASYVWHVLRVQPNSPAYVAGIMPDEYVLNCEGGLLSTGGEDLLGKVVYSVYNKWRLKQQQNPTYGGVQNATPCSLVLYVYNHDYDTVRPVTIYPNEQWGGRGLLGCDIGYGLLHRLPEPQLGGQQMAPGTVMFQAPGSSPAMQSYDPSGSDSLSASAPLPPSANPSVGGGQPALLNQVHAPAFQSGSAATPGGTPTSTRKKKSKAGAYTANLDDYFKEEEAKSQELDGPSAPVTGDVPPPPKPKGKA